MSRPVLAIKKGRPEKGSDEAKARMKQVREAQARRMLSDARPSDANRE